MTFTVAVEDKMSEGKTGSFRRVAQVRLKTSFDDQPAISPFLEVHAVLFQVSLCTGRRKGREGGGKKVARSNAQ